MSKASVTPAHHSFAALSFIDYLGDEKNDPLNGLAIAKEPVYIFASNILPWAEEYQNLPDIENTPEYHHHIKKNILFAKHITKKNAHLSIRRYDWKPGVTYTEWKYDQNSLYPENWLSKSQPCYVFVETYESKDENNNVKTNFLRSVFMCISNNGGAISTIPPRNKDFESFTTEDGYTWKYMYDIEEELYNEWANDEFIPIPTNDAELSQRNKELLSQYEEIKYDSKLKNIVEIKIIDQGEGYDRTHGIVVQIDGDGTGALAELRWVVKETTDENNRPSYTWEPKIYVTDSGKGYTQASVKILCYDKDNDGKSVVKRQMKAEAVINPITYLGSNIVNDMQAHFVSIKGTFDDIEGETDTSEDKYETNGGNFPVVAAYRRIGLIKNVKMKNGMPLLKNKSRYFDILKLNNTTGFIHSLSQIEGVTSFARATVWYSYNDASNDMFLYLINRTGYFTLDEYNVSNSEYISDVNTNVTGRVCGFVERNMDPLAGEIMYIENTPPIHRSLAQKETFLFTVEL